MVFTGVTLLAQSLLVYLLRLLLFIFTLLVERLERSRLELSKTLARLEKNSRDKSTLLTTISHELRTPLNGIIGLSRIPIG